MTLPALLHPGHKPQCYSTFNPLRSHVYLLRTRDYPSVSSNTCFCTVSRLSPTLLSILFLFYKSTSSFWRFIICACAERTRGNSNHLPPLGDYGITSFPPREKKPKKEILLSGRHLGGSTSIYSVHFEIWFQRTVGIKVYLEERVSLEQWPVKGMAKILVAILLVAKATRRILCEILHLYSSFHCKGNASREIEGDGSKEWILSV